MIDIAQLQSYFACDRVFVTAHAAEKFRQRGIRAKDFGTP